MKLNDIRDNIDEACSDFIKERGSKHPRFRSFLRNLIIFLEDMRCDYVSQYAAQAAFFTVLSAVPFLMLVILCLKYFVEIDVSAVTAQISSSFPTQISAYMSQIITEIFYRSDSIATLSFTIIAALWASSRGTMAIYCGLNQIDGYVKIYNWFAARITSFFYNLILVAIIVATIIVLIFGNTIISVISEMYKPLNLAFSFIMQMKFPIFFVMLSLAFTALYTFLPQRRLKFRKQLPGAILVALGWMIFSYLFSVYIEYFARYSILYGSLTAIVLLMLWIFFSIYMLLIGAEINKHIESGFFRHVKMAVFGKRAQKKQ